MAIFKPNLSRDVMNLIFTPATVAYAIIAVKYAWFGLALYSVFLAQALGAGLFHRLRDWPTVSKVALLMGPLLLVFALVSDINVIRYWAVLPAVLYTVLAGWGGLALRKAKLD